jgi:hypothetical protein
MNRLHPYLRRSDSSNVLPALWFAALLLIAPVSFGGTEGDWSDYKNDLATMNVAGAHQNYTGEGTALVHMENKAIFWDAEYKPGVPLAGKPLFGGCDKPDGANDQRGWSPEDVAGSEEGCKVVWVMCFRSGPVYPTRRSCAIKSADRYHATNVAQGLSLVAPGAKIISIQINSTSGRAYQLAAEWLTTPSSDEAWYLAHAFTEAEANFYNTHFGGASPAEFWNIVAINGAYNHSGGKVGLDANGNYDFNNSDETPWVEGKIKSTFSESCDASNPDRKKGLRPDKYIDDWWLLHGAELAWGTGAYEGYDLGSATLQTHGIMPFFAAGNWVWKKKQRNVAGEKELPDTKFATQNGVGFPACLSETFAVSSVGGTYDNGRTNRWKYVGSNVHPQLTDFVAPGGATSFSTPMVAGAVAVLRSNNLTPKASIDDIKRYLGAIRTDGAGEINNEVEVGFSCDPDVKMPEGIDIFPLGEHSSLNCNNGDPVPEPYASPYTKTVIDLGAAVELAVQDRDEISINLIEDLNNKTIPIIVDD